MSRFGLRLLGGGRPGVAASFDPSGISGLVAWYDASDASTITDTGGAVDQWNDKSGNGWHLNNSRAGATGRPTTGTRTLNSLNVLDFDGSNDSIGVALSPSSGRVLGLTRTIFIVAQQDTTHIGSLLTEAMTSADEDYIRLLVVNGPLRFSVRDDNGADDISLNSTSNLSAARIVTVTWTTAGSGTGSLRVNGTEEASDAAWGSAPSGLNYFAIGRMERLSPTQPFNGIIAEVIIYDRVLDPGEIDDVEGYLATKWGVAL